MMKRLLLVLALLPLMGSTYIRRAPLFPAAGSGPDPAWVQTANSGSPCGSGVSNIVVATFASNVTAASAIVVIYSADTTGDATACSAATVADTLLNSYTVATSRNNSTNNQCVGIAYAANSGAGANEVIVTFPTTVDFRTSVILEYSNVATTSPSDGANNALTTTSPWLSGSITTTVDKDMVVGGVECSGATTTNHAPGASFTERFPNPTAGGTWTCRIAVVDQVQTSAGAIQASGAVTGGTVGNCTSVALALKKKP